jgi:hypothetical protein
MREFLSTLWSLIAIVVLLATVRNPDTWKGEWEGYVFAGIALLGCLLLAIGWRDLGRNRYSRILRWFFLPLMLPLLLVVGLSGILIFPLIAGMVYFGIDLFILAPRRKPAANRRVMRKWR